MRLTLSEQERLAFVSGRPVSPVLMDAVDQQRQIENLEIEVADLQERIDVLEGLIDGQLEEALDDCRDDLRKEQRVNAALRRHLSELHDFLVSPSAKTAQARKNAAASIKTCNPDFLKGTP